MTIIFNAGGNFWIEHIDLPTIVLTDPAGRLSSTIVNLEKPGEILTSMICQKGGPDTDNSQAVGSFDLRTEAASAMNPGTFITGCLWRVNKLIGTAGDTNANAYAMVFLRKRGIPS